MGRSGYGIDDPSRVGGSVMTTRLAKLWFRQACVLTLVMVGVLLVVVLFAPDNASSMTGPTLSVTGSGVDGTETLEVKVNGLSEGSLTFGTNLSSQSVVLSADTEWEDIELSFTDGPGKDLTVSSFSLDADQRFVVPGDVLISGQWTGTTCSALGPPIGETIHCSGVIQFPAAVDGPAPIGDLDPSYWGNAQTVVPVYDTAWDMGVQVTLEQGEEYMDFLVDAGFSGFATTYLGNIHAPAQPPGGNFYVTKDGIGNSIASWDDATGHLDMDPAHADHFEDILDAAHARGLRVMLLVVWERKTVEQYGLLNEGNVYDWGFQLGTRFANHPAIQAWTLGGDAGTDEPRTQFWTNVSNGLRDAGVTGDMNFHTGSSTARRVNQIDAPWNTGQLVMTSHCADTALATSRLNTVMAQADIHVWAGEPRYEGIYPTWCPDPYVPTAQDIVDDALSFVDAGVAGVFYGHNERWQWGHGLEGSDGRGWQGVQDSFNAPGAFALIEALTEYQPPTGPPPNVVINEIHYHPADGGVEFVELYNAEDETVDISGWDLDGMMTFAAGTEILADGYIVATADVALFQSTYPGVVAVQWEAGSDLENTGEAVSLNTNAMVLVDDVSYNNEAPWPIEPNGNGPSLELTDPSLDNGLGSNWEVSAGVGSPGSTNVAVDVSAPVVSSVVPVDGAVVLSSSVDVVAQVADAESGVDRVRVFVRKNATGEYWDGLAWVSGWSWVLADLAPEGWVVPGIDVSDPSAYRVLVWAWDVEGNLANWTDHASPTFEVVAPDVSAPVVSSVVPADGAIVTTSSIDVAAEVSDEGSGVQRVQILIRKASTGEYWNGSGWVSTWSWVLADLTPEGWFVPGVDVSDPSLYRVLVWAWDVEGNLATWSDHASPTFEALGPDTAPPVVSSLTPEDGAFVERGTPLDVVAQVSDEGSGVDRVRIFIRKNSTGEYWDGSSWVSNWSWVLAEETPDGWVLADVDVSDPSTYRALVWAWDGDDNLANWMDNPNSTFESDELG